MLSNFWVTSSILSLSSRREGCVLSYMVFSCWQNRDIRFLCLILMSPRNKFSEHVCAREQNKDTWGPPIGLSGVSSCQLWTVVPRTGSWLLLLFLKTLFLSKHILLSVSWLVFSALECSPNTLHVVGKHLTLSYILSPCKIFSGFQNMKNQ